MAANYYHSIAVTWETGFDREGLREMKIDLTPAMQEDPRLIAVLDWWEELALEEARLAMTEDNQLNFFGGLL